MKKANIIKPYRLCKGDTIGIVAPASSFDKENFLLGLRFLRRLGYRIKYERAIYNKCWSQPGHDKQRGRQINRMFADRDVRAIFCAQAGYGSVDIVPYLDKDIIRNNPKIFVGYSDITVLLLYIQEMTNMLVFHGPVISGEIHEGMNQRTLDYLMRVITRPTRLAMRKCPDLSVFRPGTATGRLVGGNLSLIADAIGTPYEINTRDRILFLEDVSEDLDAVGRYLNKMREAGKFEGVKGFLFGKMVDCFDKRQHMKEVIMGAAGDNGAPIIFGFPSGHVARKGELRITLPLGVLATIDADRMRIRIHEAAVR